MLIAKEIATDFEVGPGDPLQLTLFPDDKDQSRNVTFTVEGVFRSVPPSNPPAEMVIAAAGLPPYLLAPPDFYLARTPSQTTPATAAAELRHSAVGRAAAVSTVAGQTRATRSLTALNLGPLAALEAAGAGLIAAVGVAVLGAFIVLERRREAAILEAVGADARQLRTGPAQEGAIAVAVSTIIGVPIGLLLALLSVRVLGLFFTLPPPLLDVPTADLVAFVAAMAAVSAVAVGAALARIRRVSAATLLREP